jgi:hypothetical protein
MGRSYWFECSRCGYRAKVAGREDRGADFFVQTILCRDCRELYDAVTRTRVTDASGAGSLQNLSGGLRRSGLFKLPGGPKAPPNFQSALNRLRHSGITHPQWARFEVRCPVSSGHLIEKWNEPGKCPRCGLVLEKNALPYRIWD